MKKLKKNEFYDLVKGTWLAGNQDNNEVVTKIACSLSLSDIACAEFGTETNPVFNEVCLDEPSKEPENTNEMRFNKTFDKRIKPLTKE